MARVRIAGRILHEFMMQNESESRNPLGVSSVDGVDGEEENLNDFNADEY